MSDEPDEPVYEIHEGQQSLERERTAQPNAEGKDCEWCGDPAHWALERKAKGGRMTGQFIYACLKHGPIASQMANNER